MRTSPQNPPPLPHPAGGEGRGEGARAFTALDERARASADRRKDGEPAPHPSASPPPSPQGRGKEKVLLGSISAPHGVRGLLKVRSYTADPADIVSYGPLTDAQGRVFKLKVMHQVKESVVVAIDGVPDRNAAEKLRGIDLYVDRAALPAPEEEDEFYLADLIGLMSVTEAGEPFGTVRAVQDFGAGDVLEIAPAAGGPTLYLPFTREVVPEVDLKAGRLVVVPPAEVEVGTEEEAGP